MIKIFKLILLTVTIALATGCAVDPDCNNQGTLTIDNDTPFGYELYINNIYETYMRSGDIIELNVPVGSYSVDMIHPVYYDLDHYSDVFVGDCDNVVERFIY